MPIVAIASGKGGVGKATVAVDLALALCEQDSGPPRQNTASSSTTGRPVISPGRRARADLPAPPRPRIATPLHLPMMTAGRGAS